MAEEGRGSFGSSDASGRVLGREKQENGQYAFVPVTDVVQSIGEQAIASALRAKNKSTEFSLANLPKIFRVFNRAERGNIKVWSSGFDSATYPEGATEDHGTWLQPGQTMILPLDATLHFFGNIFNPTFENAKTVIESCGGFLMEAKALQQNAEVPPRIVGGPLFLPDFLIEGLDGRNRVVFGPFALFDEYDRLTRRLQQKSLLHDKDVRREHERVLLERLREFSEGDGLLYDQFGRPIESEDPPEPPKLCDCFPVEHVLGVRGCKGLEPQAAAKTTKGKTNETVSA